MTFQPDPNQTLSIDDINYVVTEHPSAPGIPYGQEGRAATVFQLTSPSGTFAFKVFKPRFRTPSLVTQAEQLTQYAGLPGLQVCQRIVLTPFRHAPLLRTEPDLTYAVLMPWVEGTTWQEMVAIKTTITPRQSLAAARELAKILALMEERSMAHCDISGSNLILSPDLTAVSLVDVEGIYAPTLNRPEALPSGSPGYAHKSVQGGVWSPQADRFSGAVILAEMLGLCLDVVKTHSWGETFFEPAELQQESPRYQTLVSGLRSFWGEAVVNLFQRVWKSDRLVDCPTFGEWLVTLPEKPIEVQSTPAKKPAEVDSQIPFTVIQFMMAAERSARDHDWQKSVELYTLAVQAAGAEAVPDVKAWLEEISSQPPPTTQPAAPAAKTSPDKPQPAEIKSAPPVAIPPITTASPQPLTIPFAPGVAMEFVYIPAGEFLMGSAPSDREAVDEERPQHPVWLSEYWMGKYPVTNEQYQAFVNLTGSKMPDHWKNGKIPQGKEKHPVANVNWQDAANFCNWLSSQSGKKVYLPSEAQWEKAARGDKGFLYPWGNRKPDTSLSNFGGSTGSTSEVGAYSPQGDSPYGCADMAGNVWEWCLDWFHANFYSSRPYPDINPLGPAFTKFRVMRGGSFFDQVKDIRTTRRSNDNPFHLFNNVGFRIVLIN
jgi:formylglycine-generating enzyme required for sulfatase activity